VNALGKSQPASTTATAASKEAPAARARTGKPARVSLLRFAGPRYWGTWLGLVIVRASMLLPFRVQMACGRALGRVAWLFAARERHVADVNLRLSLPELDAAQRRALIRRHFQSLGCALLETGLIWWARPERMRRLVRIEGIEHLENVLRAGRGAILLSAHFTSLEMGACALTLTLPTAIMYQVPKNPLIAELSLRGRLAHAVRAISSDSVRDLLQALKDNLPVWYAPDQRDSSKSAALVPFFGIPAATSIATSRIARISGAAVLPYFPERLADGSGYLMRLGAPLEGFPSDDPVADVLRYHTLIEAQARRCPEQYLWIYKRFKHAGADPYVQN
jgi:KDO2-lipid IV(A) lauroyltransferase